MEQFIEAQELGLGQASLDADLLEIVAAHVSIPHSRLGAQSVSFECDCGRLTGLLAALRCCKVQISACQPPTELMAGCRQGLITSVSTFLMSTKP